MSLDVALCNIIFREDFCTDKIASKLKVEKGSGNAK